MSIFGIKKYENNLTLRVNDLHRKILVYTNAGRIKQTVENLKSTITISAETKGDLVNGEVFSFGNAGREKDVGYVVMRRGHITGIGLSCKKTSGEVRVAVLVDGVILKGCEITLHTRPRKHDNFETPFLVEAGSTINFVCMGGNRTAINTVASLLFEF